MSVTVIDVHDELATAKGGPRHWLLAAMMGALTFFDGYDTFNPAYVLHYVAGPWGLAPGQAGLLVSSGLVGFLIGAAGHGVVADRFGRRVTLLGGLWITNVFTLATALFLSPPPASVAPEISRTCPLPGSQDCADRKQAARLTSVTRVRHSMPRGDEQCPTVYRLC